MISWIIKTSCLYYLPQPSASADNTDLGFDNSWYHAQPHPIIVYYYSFKLFLCFWLAKSTCIIHHNQEFNCLEPHSRHDLVLKYGRIKRLVCDCELHATNSQWVLPEYEFQETSNSRSYLRLMQLIGFHCFFFFVLKTNQKLRHFCMDFHVHRFSCKDENQSLQKLWRVQPEIVTS